jgi:hypothetical protein
MTAAFPIVDPRTKFLSIEIQKVNKMKVTIPNQQFNTQENTTKLWSLFFR